MDHKKWKNTVRLHWLRLCNTAHHGPVKRPPRTNKTLNTCSCNKITSNKKEAIQNWLFPTLFWLIFCLAIITLKVPAQCAHFRIRKREKNLTILPRYCDWFSNNKGKFGNTIDTLQFFFMQSVRSRKRWLGSVVTWGRDPAPPFCYPHCI